MQLRIVENNFIFIGVQKLTITTVGKNFADLVNFAINFKIRHCLALL